MPIQASRTLKYFYKVLWNNGHLLSLVIPYKKVKSLDTFYKTNFDKNPGMSFDDFESAFPTQFALIKKSKSAYCEIKKQYTDQKGLQPCILTECFTAQTIANALNLDRFIDLEAGGSVPIELLELERRNRGFSDGATFRYCYYNDRYDAVLYQCGSSNTIDIVFIKFNISIRIEIKEKASKLEEPDITGLYNERGKLQVTREFSHKHPKYVPFIHVFNAMTNVFEMEGHNFSLVPHLTKENAESIVNSVIGSKVIDLFVFVVDNELVPVLTEFLFDFVSFKGSEIRTAGKNKNKLFTPEFAKRKIADLGGTIDTATQIVTMPYSSDSKKKARGKDIENRYNIGSLIFVYLEDAVIDSAAGTVQFPFDKIWQKRPTISIHLNPQNNAGAVLSQAMQLGLIIEED